MPGLDGTGPFGDASWQCRRAYGIGAGFRGGFGRRLRQGYPVVEPVSLDKDQQKKILSAQLTELEAEKQAIENKLKQLGE
jgi:hypothetical protein